jgi:stage II sporulation protein M
LGKILRYSLYLTVAFLVGIALGIAYSSLQPERAGEYMKRIAQGLGGLSENPFKNFLKIFVHNSWVALLTLVSGLFFGIGPGILVMTNGFVVGLVAEVLLENGMPSKTLILGLVPHGIVEIPAFILAGAAGVCWYKKIVEEEDKGRGFKEGASMAIKAYGVVLAMLLLAAFIEAYITPHVAGLG